MRILLTNDDGYTSEGIKILETVLNEYGHEISVCAPSNQRSASSHSVSLRDSIQIHTYGENHYHCSGTPADCLLYSFRSGLLNSEEFDLVISGINHGLNISSDILYSGTVSAAKEAVMIGMKAMAISLELPNKNESHSFEKAARFLAENIDNFYQFCTESTIININVPHNVDINNWKSASIGQLDYKDSALITDGGLDDIKNQIINKITLGLNMAVDKPDLINSYDAQVTDYELINDNVIAVSVLNVMPQISELQNKLQALEGRF